jgi:hypothetical protein
MPRFVDQVVGSMEIQSTILLFRLVRKREIRMLHSSLEDLNLYFTRTLNIS